jgi:NTE family protein
MTGLIAGLAESGIDLAGADLMVGTSAGSVVTAQLRSGVPIRQLYEEQLREASGEIAAKIGLGFYIRFVGASLFPGNERNARARLGRAALRARTVPEAERIEVIGSRLPSREWPEGRLLVTSVDAESGEAVVFDRSGQATLVEAVAASCAVPLVWPPVTIQGHRYMDGGVRSIANADLARGCDRVLVLAPVTFALRRSNRISTQLASLGSAVRSLVISPDAQSRQAIGSNVLDPAQRPGSARAGHAQAAQEVARVAALWG